MVDYYVDAMTYTKLDYFTERKFISSYIKLPINCILSYIVSLSIIDIPNSCLINAISQNFIYDVVNKI